MTGWRTLGLVVLAMSAVQGCERDDTFGDRVVIQDPEETEEVRDEAIQGDDELVDPVDVEAESDPAVEGEEQAPLQ